MKRKYESPSAEKVRRGRKAAGLTQADAGSLVLSSRRAWQEWESGNRSMHPGLWELFLIYAQLSEDGLVQMTGGANEAD
jgi:putative transcriptional regulator